MKVKSLFSLLTVMLFLIVPSTKAQSGCPGCLLDLSCPANLPGGGICDTVLPTGMANNPYDEDVSFYMPGEFVDAGTGYNIILHEILITGMNGLPVGLNWQVNASGGQYFPASGDTLGCVKICGTPITSGTFNVTVFITAEVTAQGTPIGDVDATENQTYETSITILADTAGGVATFTFSPQVSSACEELTLTFDGVVNSSTNPTTWDWDFGNGSTATTQSGGTYTYNTPGVYPVSLQTTIWAYVINIVTVSDVNTNYAGDVEELTTVQNPDLYFLIPNIGYQSSTGSNSTSETWNNLGIVIPVGTDSVSIEVWDSDNGPPFGSADDFLGSVDIPLSVGTWAWNAGNGTYGQITIGQQPETVLDDTLMVTINANPTAPEIFTSADTICAGDSVTLNIDSIPHFIRWYQDSVEIPGTNVLEYITHSSGHFQVAITDANGCSAISDSTYIKVASNPGQPTFGVQTGNMLVTQVNAASYQWFMDSVAIAGATSSSYHVTQGGIYQLAVSNIFGCTTISNGLFYEPVGIEETELIQSVSLFPNPTTQGFEVSFVSQGVEPVQLQVFNMLGEMVYHEELSATGSVIRTQVNLQDRASGLYNVVLKSAGQEVHQKVLKQ